MKKTILIIMVILCLPLASAIYGGDSYLKTFEECDDITIIIESSRTIDDNEFILNDECTKIDNYTYNCNCTDGWVFNLTTELNTINDYNITFNYNYTKVEDISTESSGGSGGRYRKDLDEIDKPFCNTTNWNCTDWRIVNGNNVRDCYNDCGVYLLDELSKQVVYTQPIIPGQQVIDIIDPIEIEEPPQEPEDNELWIMVGLVVFFLTIGGIVWFIIWVLGR